MNRRHGISTFSNIHIIIHSGTISISKSNKKLKCMRHIRLLRIPKNDHSIIIPCHKIGFLNLSMKCFDLEVPHG